MDRPPQTETELLADAPVASVSAHPWDGFVTGPENALAHAGVLAMVRGEALGVSPLVVHGPSGVGKSRLLQGLVGEWLLRWPGSSVAHLEAEGFAALCAEAAGRNGTAGWAEVRGRFRALNLFVLDDLHDLERAPLALEELTHTLDALADAGSGVAVSARDGPGQWRGWPSRLVNRLVGGLSVRLDPPGPTSRRRFLLDRARARGVRLAAEAVDALVEAADGYRSLDGWLARLALTARVERRALDRALVVALLNEEGASPALESGSGSSPPPARADAAVLARIARDVAGRFGVTVRDLRAATRRKSVAEPRHLAMLLVRRQTGLSFQRIGDYFGGRDPATVRHACRASAHRLASDPALAAVAEALSRRWPSVRPSRLADRETL